MSNYYAYNFIWTSFLDIIIRKNLTYKKSGHSELTECPDLSLIWVIT